MTRRAPNPDLPLSGSLFAVVCRQWNVARVTCVKLYRDTVARGYIRIYIYMYIYTLRTHGESVPGLVALRMVGLAGGLNDVDLYMPTQFHHLKKYLAKLPLMTR